MNELTVFKHEKFGEVRIIDRDGDPWFVAKDVADVLELGNMHSSLALLDSDEKGTHSMETPGGKQEMTIINESGLYSMVLRSRKPEAKVFKKWVTSEVIPSIRKIGGYSVQLSPAEMLLAQAQQMVNLERNQKEQAKQIESVATRLDQIETATEYFTVIGYLRLMKKKSLPLNEAQKHGADLARLCRKRRIQMGKVPDSRFGEINSYPKFLLDEYFIL